MDFEPPGSSASSCSGTSSFELLSSHVHRLQVAFDRAESRLRVAEDHIDLLEQGQRNQEARLSGAENFLARLRALFRWMS